MDATAMMTVPAEDDSFESRTSTNNGSELTESYDIGDVSASNGDGEQLIFDGDEADERGDHVVGSDFECDDVDVIWLANPEQCGDSMDKSSNEEYYSADEVGANETATVLNKNQAKPQEDDPSQVQECAGPSLCPDGFSDPSSKELVIGKTTWSQHVDADAPVSSVANFAVDLSAQDKQRAVEDTLSPNVRLDSGKTELQRSTVPGYILHPNGIHLPLQPILPSGMAATHPNQLFQQQQELANQCAPISYLTHPMMPSSRNIVPSYSNDGFALGQQFGSAHHNFDTNASVLPFQLGPQRRPEEYVAQAAGALSGSSNYESARDSSSLPIRQDILPLQHPFAPPFSVEPFSMSPFFSQQSNSTTPSFQQQWRSAVVSKANAIRGDITHRSNENTRVDDAGRSFLGSRLQPLSSSHVAEISGPAGRQSSSRVDQRGCCLPMLTTSTESIQAPETEDADVQGAQMSCHPAISLSTALSSKAPLFNPRTPPFASHDKPRSYLSVVKYPAMADVNFRRRHGSKTPSRPRHLCDQTREVIGRVCAYFREFSKRFADLGNNTAGTPFEHPERMASHATGFALPTIRRCGERVEVVPHCSYRPGSLPTAEELHSLTSVFADEPWFTSAKERGRANGTRKKAKKKFTPSPATSDAEADLDNPTCESLSENDREPEDLESDQEAVPKRRRSQRIRNQRRAKQLSRSKTKNCDEKTLEIASTTEQNLGKCSTRIKNRKTVPSSFPNLIGKNCNAVTESHANVTHMSGTTKKRQSHIVPRTRNKRSRRASSPTSSLHLKDDQRRCYNTAQRSRSLSLTFLECNSSERKRELLVDTSKEW